MKTLCAATICLIACLAPAIGHSADDSETLTAPVSTTSHALIVCGHPGDEAHRQQYAQSVARIRTGLIEQYSFAADDIHILFAEGNDAAPLPDESEAEESDAYDMAWQDDAPAASRENLEATITKLTDAVGQDDSLWVITIGHAHLDKGRSWFNLPGPDLQQTQFAELFNSISAQQQVFLLTTPVSGYYVKPLSKPGRVIITATEGDREVNETLYPHALAEVLETPAANLTDFDEDGTITMFDLHLNIVRNVADRYFDEELLSTEHAQLDDNGDKRPTEIQRHFLPEDRGGLPASRQRKRFSSKADGQASRRIKLAEAKPVEVENADGAETNADAI